MLENYDVLKDIQLQIFEISPEKVLFKIFGSEHFDFQKAYSQNKVDWSGFYTQLTPQHSMRYLTKKWSDGAECACLIQLNPNKNLKTLKISHPYLFSTAKISGEEKANYLKKKLREIAQTNQEYNRYAIADNEILLQKMGEKQTLVECIDCEDYEVIIPHAMLNEDYFHFQQLISFQKSNDGMLRTIGWRFTENSPWKKIVGQTQFEPYLILKQEPDIQQLLKQTKNF